MNRPTDRHRRRGFTLVELLVAMGIIAVLSAVTVLAVAGIAKDARLSSGANAVVAALSNGRALAMKNNEVVLVAFRANWDTTDPSGRQFTEVVLARWTGDTIADTMPDVDGNPDDIDIVRDRFEPIPDIATRVLPEGIKVAGPRYGSNVLFNETVDDNAWFTQPEFRATINGETPGRLVGVMFGPDGKMVMENPQNQVAAWMAPSLDERIDYAAYVDFDRDEVQAVGSTTIGPTVVYDEPGDEPNVVTVPFLAVYDDDVAREIATTNWNNAADYENQLTGPDGYITLTANRIHFNRYSGVIMR